MVLFLEQTQLHLFLKFPDDAVANFGTDNDLKISHDDTHARITNTKGDIVVSGIISATSDIKVGSGNYNGSYQIYYYCN